MVSEYESAGPRPECPSASLLHPRLPLLPPVIFQQIHPAHGTLRFRQHVAADAAPEATLVRGAGDDPPVSSSVSGEEHVQVVEPPGHDPVRRVGQAEAVAELVEEGAKGGGVAAANGVTENQSRKKVGKSDAYEAKATEQQQQQKQQQQQQQ